MNKIKQLLLEKEAVGNEAEQLCGVISRKRKEGLPVEADRARLDWLNTRMEEIFQEYFSLIDQPGPRHFTRENTWVWGGPTPRWGGSMKPDCAVDGADFFGVENIVYVYGPVDEEAILLHQKAKKLLCQLTEVSRSPGASRGTDAETAARLSELSLKYTNIKGGIIDDLIGHVGRDMQLDTLVEINRNLKSKNPDLKLYSVVYVAELDNPNVALVEPYIDCVNLWVGLKPHLTDLDSAIEKCRLRFPGKEIMLGIFLYDYFNVDNENTPAFLDIELRRARKYLSEGKIHDLVILGDREVSKVPRAAAFARDFIKAEVSLED